jgi:hypothetical protein
VQFLKDLFHSHETTTLYLVFQHFDVWNVKSWFCIAWSRVEILCPYIILFSNHTLYGHYFIQCRWDRVRCPVKKKIGSTKKGGGDKNFYTKSVRLTRSCWVTWARSEGLNFEQYKIILLFLSISSSSSSSSRNTKHMQQSRDPGPNNLYRLPLPSRLVGNDFTNSKFLITTFSYKQ